MFSIAEKRMIAAKVEELLLSLNHPEMQKSKPMFVLRVDGAEPWSYAIIQPNHMVTDTSDTNPWNEHARQVMNKCGE